MLNRSFSSSFSKKGDTTTVLPSRYYIPGSELTFCSKDKIGQGASGVVFAGTYMGKPVAVKQFSFDNPALPLNKELLLKEAAELVILDHDNIIKCYGVCQEQSSLILELARRELLVDGKQCYVHSLRQLTEMAGDLPEETKHEALFQIANGLSYLHSRKITHGDLKSANVLVTGSGHEVFFKLGDFGSAHAQLTSKLTTANMTAISTQSRAGTTPFEAPEVFKNYQKTSKSDIYAFSMIMYELQFPKLAHPWESVFGTEVRIDTLSALIITAVQRGERPPVKNESPYTHLMKKCWDNLPENRPTAFELKNEIVELHQVDYFVIFLSSSIIILTFLEISCIAFGV